MRARMVLAAAALLVVVAPAQASAGGFGGIVIAKQPQRGTLVLAAPGGMGLTLRAASGHVRLGDRVRLQGLRLRDGTIRASHLRVVSHTRLAMVRGTVVRQLWRSTLVALGRSVITIRHHAGRRLASASDHGGLRVGAIGDFRVRIDDDDLVQAAVVPVGQAANVQIEGAILSVSPFVVSIEGLPITITVPAGTKLPATLSAGQRIELTVGVGAANAFSLVAIGEVENVNEPVAPNPVAPNQEVEVKGAVVTSTATQLVVSAGGATFTFMAPAGVTLPTFPAGTFVEARGHTVDGVLTLDRVRAEDNDEDHDNSGPGGGAGDDGGGGGGDHGGSGHGGHGGDGGGDD